MNRECVGCLDYKTHEVALPDGKVLIIFSVSTLKFTK